jgi:hypothetical protein
MENVSLGNSSIGFIPRPPLLEIGVGWYAQAGLTCLTAGQYDKIARSTNNTRACIDHIVLSNDWLQYFHGAIEAWPSEQEIDSGLTDHFGMLVDLAI